MTENIPLWAILRVDDFHAEHVPVEVRLTVQAVVVSQERATAEVERLNAQASDNVRYVVQYTRLKGGTVEEFNVWMDENGEVIPGIRGFNARARRFVGPWERISDAY